MSKKKKTNKMWAIYTYTYNIINFKSIKIKSLSAKFDFYIGFTVKKNILSENNL